MVNPIPARAPRSYAEAVLLGLVVHNLIAGAACVLLGLPSAADFLWAIGSGLSLGYALYWLSSAFATHRRRARFIVVAVVFLAMVVAAALRVFLVGDLLGALLLVALQIRTHHPRHASPAAESTPEPSAAPDVVP